jgi:hypothetical protein
VVLGVRLKQRLTKERIDGMIAQFQLSWVCAYIGSAYCIADNGLDVNGNPLSATKEIILPINKAALLPYIDSKLVLDTVSGEIIGYEPVSMGDEIIIAWYAGEQIVV